MAVTKATRAAFEDANNTALAATTAHAVGLLSTQEILNKKP